MHRKPSYTGNWQQVRGCLLLVPSTLSGTTLHIECLQCHCISQHTIATGCLLSISSPNNDLDDVSSACSQHEAQKSHAQKSHAQDWVHQRKLWEDEQTASTSQVGFTAYPCSMDCSCCHMCRSNCLTLCACLLARLLMQAVESRMFSASCLASCTETANLCHQMVISKNTAANEHLQCMQD